MKPLDCAAAEELFSDHYDGTLAPEARAALEAHLSTCPTCRALREVFGEVVDALHRVRDRPLALPSGLAQRSAAASFAAPPAVAVPAPASARVKVRELPVGLQVAAALLAIFITLAILAASGAFGTEGSFGRVHARFVTTGVYLGERKERLAEDWRLLRIVVGTAFEGRLDLVQERIEAYRRRLEKKPPTPSPEPEASPTPAERPRKVTYSNSSPGGLVPSDERQERRHRASGEQGARS